MIDLFSSCLPRPPEGSTSLTLTSALASSLACLPDLAQFLTCMPWLLPSTPANMVATGPAPEPQPSIQHEPSLAAASNSLPTTRETSTAHPNQHATSQQIMCAEKTMPGGPPSAPAHEPARAFPSQPSDSSQAVPIDASADDSSPQLLDAASPAFHLESSKSLAQPFDPSHAIPIDAAADDSSSQPDAANPQTRNPAADRPNRHHRPPHLLLPRPGLNMPSESPNLFARMFAPVLSGRRFV